MLLLTLSKTERHNGDHIFPSLFFLQIGCQQSCSFSCIISFYLILLHIVLNNVLHTIVFRCVWTICFKKRFSFFFNIWIKGNFGCLLGLASLGKTNCARMSSPVVKDRPIVSSTPLKKNTPSPPLPLHYKMTVLGQILLLMATMYSGERKLLESDIGPMVDLRQDRMVVRGG